MSTTHDFGEVRGLATVPGPLAVACFAFLTVADLFGTQAILPMLAQAYGVSPGAMGTAVNACTLGMAIAGFLVACFGRRIDRRAGTALALALLALPTALLAFAPTLYAFAALRVVQGLLMATAFTLTLAHIAGFMQAGATATLFAAYITGNVASNLVGRLLAAGIADHLGFGATFGIFALLNLAGAGLAWSLLARMDNGRADAAMSSASEIGAHLGNPRLLAAFAIGFCILFAFIGTFTYVNFVLVRPPVSLGMMALGFIYVVFLPSIVTTPLAGAVAGRLGTERALRVALAIAGLGLVMLLGGSLWSLVPGMALFAVGTFLAQALASGFVGRTAVGDTAAASGLYLASYFLGGIVGSAVLGLAFEALGWTGVVAGVGASLSLAGLLTRALGK